MTFLHATFLQPNSCIPGINIYEHGRMRGIIKILGNAIVRCFSPGYPTCSRRTSATFRSPGWTLPSRAKSLRGILRLSLSLYLCFRRSIFASRARRHLHLHLPTYLPISRLEARVSIKRQFPLSSPPSECRIVPATGAAKNANKERGEVGPRRSSEDIPCGIISL